jgi:hypothetical protein
VPRIEARHEEKADRTRFAEKRPVSGPDRRPRSPEPLTTGGLSCGAALRGRQIRRKGAMWARAGSRNRAGMVRACRRYKPPDSDRFEGADSLPWVGVLGDQLDVLLKRLLGVGVVGILPVGITQEVVSGRIGRGELRGLLVVLDRLREILLAKVIACQVEVRTLVIRVRRDQLIEIFLLRLSPGGQGAIRRPTPPFPFPRQTSTPSMSK